jgi:hypothetical protein
MLLIRVIPSGHLAALYPAMWGPVDTSDIPGLVLVRLSQGWGQVAPGVTALAGHQGTSFRNMGQSHQKELTDSGTPTVIRQSEYMALGYHCSNPELRLYTHTTMRASLLVHPSSNCSATSRHAEVGQW